MVEKNPGQTPGRDDGQNRALEGVLRTEFGRRRSNAVDRAMEQLQRESLHNKVPSPEPPSVPFGKRLASFFWRWFPIVATIVLVVSAAFLFTVWRGSQTEKERLADALKEAKQYVKSQDLDKLIDAAFDVLHGADLEKAEKAFGEILKLHPTSPDAHFGLGEVRRRQDRPSEAELLFQTAIKLKPDYAAPHTGLGLVFEKNGKIDEAEKLYNKAIELDSKDLAAHVNLGNISKEQPGRLTQAQALFRAAINHHPNDAAAHHGLAQALMRSGNFGEAELLARRACALEPGSAKLVNTLGEIFRLLGRLDEAQTQYLRALDLDSSLASARNNLGILYAERGQLEQAEKVYREILRKETNHVSQLPALVNLAIVCGKQSKVNEAETLFREALALAPDEPRITHAFALFLADHNLKLAEALSLAKQAVAVTPNNPDYLDALGWVLFRRGDVIAAEATLQSALGLAGDTAAAKTIREHIKKLNEKGGPQ